MGEQSGIWGRAETKRAAVNSSLSQAEMTAWRQKLCSVRQEDAAFQTASCVAASNRIQRSLSKQLSERWRESRREKWGAGLKPTQKQNPAQKNKF